MTDWRFFHGDGKEKQDVVEKLKDLEPPPWRRFGREEDIPDNGRWEKVLELVQEKEKDKTRGENFCILPKTGEPRKEVKEVINAVNAAIYLRRPLLITGKPGSGKTSLAYAIAHELNLGSVLSWSITTRTTLQDGLYRYDAIARLQDANLAKLRDESQKRQDEEQNIGKYITLGALGTAFLPAKLPRVLLIDEIDKSDINLPNDLLNIFEEGEFQIPELVRSSKSQSVEDSQDKNSQDEQNLRTDNASTVIATQGSNPKLLETGNECVSPNENSQEQKTQEQEYSFKVNTQDKGIDAVIKGGWVRCYAFPIIVMTSNGEKDFPSAFKRRCVRITMPDPQLEELKAIVESHFADEIEDFEDAKSEINELIEEFLQDKDSQRATDQLLNTIHILTGDLRPKGEDEKSIKDILWQSLSE